MSPASRIALQERRFVVVTMDQRDSRSSTDVVDARRRDLNVRYRPILKRSFTRTAGDEMQAVATELSWLIDLLLIESRAARWWIGVGLGSIDEPLGRTARDSRGEAFYRAREAVERAKRSAWGFALTGGPALQRAEQCLIAASWIVRKRTARQHEAVTLHRTEGQSKLVAGRLGISEPSVSERLSGAGMAEEDAARELAWWLLLEAARP